MNSTIRWGALLGLMCLVQGCVVRPGPGRVAVAVPLPVPVPVVRVPVHTAPTVVVAPSPVVVVPASPPQAGPHGPMPSAQGGYPTAGVSMLGVVRGIEGLGSPGRDAMLRVTVLMNDQSLRQFDVVPGDWRVGQRVRVEGDRLVR